MVRDAKLDDLPGINEIENWAIENTFAHFGEGFLSLGQTESDFLNAANRYPWLVKDRGGILAGFARAAPWKSREAYRWTVEVGVYVHPDHQGQGIGRELYEALFPRLESMGYRIIVAGITLPNAASVRLHESMGMVQAANFPCMGFKHGEWRPVGYWFKEVGQGPPIDAIGPSH